MTPVKQSCLYAADGIGNGDCLVACLASLLDLPLWMVPPFHQMFGRGGGVYRERCDEWLAKFFNVKMFRTEAEDVAGVQKLPEFYIANGLSARGVYHSVIYRSGMLVHDPHPSDDGIQAVDWYWHLDVVGKKEVKL